MQSMFQLDIKDDGAAFCGKWKDICYLRWKTKLDIYTHAPVKWKYNRFVRKTLMIYHDNHYFLLSYISMMWLMQIRRHRFDFINLEQRGKLKIMIGGKSETP